MLMFKYVSTGFVFKHKISLTMSFCNQELVDMIQTLGEFHKNCLIATNVYQERFVELRLPDERNLEKVMARFNRIGSAT